VDSSFDINEILAAADT